MVSIEDLKKAADEFATLREEILEIISTINVVEMVTPVNYIEEKDHWMANVKKGEFGNPEFKYDEELLAEIAAKEDSIKRMIKTMEGINVHNEAGGFLKRHYVRALKDALGSAEMALQMTLRK